MKKCMFFIGALVLVIMLTACATNRASSTTTEPERKMLIVYYSLTGNGKFVAEYIQSLTGADVFEIKPVEPYSVEFAVTLERAIREREAGILPQLIGRVDNLADYDVIFLGTPNWFGTLSLPFLSFLNSHDLSGKTIVPVIMFGMGGLQNTITDLKAALPYSTFLEEFGSSSSNVRNSQPEILQWLDRIGVLR